MLIGGKILNPVKVSHAAKRCAALAKLEESSWNEAVQRARAVYTQRPCAVLQERKKKMMTEMDRLTVRCDELDYEYRCDSGPAKKAKEMCKLCVEVQRLKIKLAKSAGFVLLVRVQI